MDEQSNFLHDILDASNAGMMSTMYWTTALTQDTRGIKKLSFIERVTDPGLLTPGSFQNR